MRVGMKLIKWDCLVEMDKLIEQWVKVDAIITSPPYNIGKMHSNHIQFWTYDWNNMNEEDYQSWQINFLDKCFEILKDDGHLFYNHKVRIKLWKAIHPMEWLLKTKFILKQEITWNMKKSANCDKIRFFPFSERVYWLSKNSKTKLYNKDCLSDVWEYVPTHKRKDTWHIAVMPEKIAENCLNAIDSKLVLDPFMWSWTTGVACKNLWRHFIWIELDDKYFEIAKNRIEDTNKLF